jgi:uncharacterized protein GlcG (DUF336 family)
MGYDGS